MQLQQPTTAKDMLFLLALLLTIIILIKTHHAAQAKQVWDGCRRWAWRPREAPCSPWRGPSSPFLPAPTTDRTTPSATAWVSSRTASSAPRTPPLAVRCSLSSYNLSHCQKKIIVLYCFHVFQLSFLIAKSIGIYVCISTIFWIIWLTHDAWMQKTSWPGSRSSLTVGDQS